MHSEQAIPGEHDINVHDSLDERWACKNFLGRSLEEAEALFRENFPYYNEDLMWMGPVAFCFYVQAAVSFLEKEKEDCDPENLHCLAATLSIHQVQHPLELTAFAPLLRDFCRSVLGRLDQYDTSSAYYFGLKEYYQCLEQFFTERANPQNHLP